MWCILICQSEKTEQIMESCRRNISSQVLRDAFFWRRKSRKKSSSAVCAAERSHPRAKEQEFNRPEKTKIRTIVCGQCHGEWRFL